MLFGIVVDGINSFSNFEETLSFNDNVAIRKA